MKLLNLVCCFGLIIATVGCTGGSNTNPKKNEGTPAQASPAPTEGSGEAAPN